MIEVFHIYCSLAVVALLWAQGFHFTVTSNLPMAFTYYGFGLGYAGLAMVFASGGQA